MEQHTYEIETTEGIVYLVIDEDGRSVEDEFELFKNDEVGQWAKNAKIISYSKIN